MKYSTYDRLDLVRLSIAIYREGVFLHRREMEEVRCRWCCFCLPACDPEEEGYDSQSKKLFFVPWDQVNMPHKPHAMNDACDESNFVRFRVGTHYINTRREVYEILHGYYNQLRNDSIV
eukprot:snap_masked-scaffold_56-processed-gene-1.19-mRNA-1 protein AED:1.00 eAED:1.00 QI:0/-1/0/0/-1/1/1/0/118